MNKVQHSMQLPSFIILAYTILPLTIHGLTTSHHKVCVPPNMALPQENCSYSTEQQTSTLHQQQPKIAEQNNQKIIHQAEKQRNNTVVAFKKSWQCYRKRQLDAINSIFKENLINKARNTILAFYEKYNQPITSINTAHKFLKDLEKLRNTLTNFAHDLINEIYYQEEPRAVTLAAGMFFNYLQHTHDNPFKRNIRDEILDVKKYSTKALMELFYNFSHTFRTKSITHLNNIIICAFENNYNDFGIPNSGSTFKALVGGLSEFYTNITLQVESAEDAAWLKLIEEAAKHDPHKKEAHHALYQLLSTHQNKMHETTKTILTKILNTLEATPSCPLNSHKRMYQRTAAHQAQ